jgi:transposase
MQSIGKSKGGWTTKFHLAISESGIESHCLSPGNHADSTYLKHLHSGIKNNNIRYIIADKGYDSDAIRNCIEAFGQKPVIPYRKNRKSRKNISGLRYQTRNIIERIFGRIKEFRRIATRYDKLDSTFLSFIACAFIQQIIS